MIRIPFNKEKMFVHVVSQNTSAAYNIPNDL